MRLTRIGEGDKGTGDKKNTDGEGTKNNEDSVGESSIKSASLNMITQMSFRIITFLLNAFVLRNIERDVMGLINVRLSLLAETLLFLSREHFRLACSSHKPKDDSWRGVLNLMWLSVPLSLLWALVLGYIWAFHLPSPPPELVPQYESAVFLVAASSVLQMLSEVPWLVAQIFLYVRLRVGLDFLWMMTRVAVLVFAVVFTPDQVVFVWACGHFLAGVIFVLGYYAAFFLLIKYGENATKCEHNKTVLPFKSLKDFLPSFQGGKYEINQEYRDVAVSFMGQGVMKQLLTEGEKYVMTIFNLLTLSEQGIYDVVSNLGSLAARFLFRPIEESSYFFFSQMWKRGEPLEKQDPGNAEKVELGLFRLLRLMALLGLVIVTFGYSYSDLLLFLYGGDNLTYGGGTNLLRAQCLLVFFLAVNGITECFARSVMTNAEINDYNKLMVVMSCCYLALTWIFTTYLGGVGLVLANCLNMSIRIYFSVKVIRQTYAGRGKTPLDGACPDNDILYLLLSTAACCQLSEIYLYPWSRLVHFLLGSLMFLMVGAAIIMKEEFILSFLVEKYRQIFGKNKVE